MTHILQIFRKDVRHLAPFLLALVALQAVFAAGTIRLVGLLDPTNRLEAVVGLCEGLIPFAWAFLVALVVQQDPPVGENAFWLTRPYSRLVVLLAKVLFVLVFLNLPLLISDCFILRIVGLPLDFGHLLLRQLPLIALVIVPAFAFASISRSVSQFSLFLVMLILAMVLESFAVSDYFHGRPPYRIPDFFAVTVFPLCVLPFIVVQFAKRAPLTRILLAILICLFIPAAFFTTHLMQDEAFFFARRPVVKVAGGDGSQIHLQLVRDKPSPRPADPNVVWFGIRMPLSVQGLPPGVILHGEGQTQIGAVGKPRASSLIQIDDGSYAIQILFPDRAVGPIAPVWTSMDFWLLNDNSAFTAKLSSYKLTKVPDVGLCMLDDARKVVCWRGPVRPPEITIRANGTAKLFAKEPNSSDLGGDSYLYDEMVWDLSPIEKRSMEMGKDISEDGEVSFAPRVLIGAFHRNIKEDAYPLSNTVGTLGINLKLRTPH